MRSLCFAVLLSASALLAQTDEVAKRVYNSSQASVFLIYLNDSGGTPTALGSAFLVRPKLLITNAHVAQAGDPVLAIGPVRIPLKIVTLDKANDLALLSVDADLTSKPLALSTSSPSPGEQIFAIGNPEGLEQTISQGIVSGIRRDGTRSLLQITSPISHGSSGGPILNSEGEVVGVAVSMLTDGQNLNFAVPVGYVISLLDQKPRPSGLIVSVSDELSVATKLSNQLANDTYSNDSESEYQQDQAHLLDLMREITARSNDSKELTQVACAGMRTFNLSEEGIKAAKKLALSKPSNATHALLAYVLLDRVDDENLIAIFAEKDSENQKAAVTARQTFLNEAAREADSALPKATGDNLLLADYVLGNVKKYEEDYIGAAALHSVVARGQLSVCGKDLTKQAYEALIFETDKAKNPDAAEKWFTRYAAQYNPEAYEWDAEGDRRSFVSDNRTAASAYEKAASISSAYGYDYCYATISNFGVTPTNEDGVLSDGRKCVEASVAETAKNNEDHFKRELPFVYRFMAMVLEERGVYTQALEYIKESISANPNEGLSFDTEADIFDDLGRYSECIAASQAAIRLSDGKYPWMNARLGSCYFASEDWARSATSFRLAATADKTDASSAFNLGLSLSRQGYMDDARLWFAEALNRKPDDHLRTKILNAMK